MRPLLALMARDARSARTLMLSLAVLAPIALLAYEELYGQYHLGHETAVWGVPAAAALFGALVASDLVSAEVSTRRIDALAALPVPLSRVWTAKVMFLSVSIIAFAGWSYASGALIFIARAPHEWHYHYLSVATEALLTSAVALPAAYSVLAFSTLMPRGFAAALAAAVSVGGLIAGLGSIDWGAHEISDAVGQVAVMGAPLLLCALLLAGSYLAFTRGPVHTGSGGRKAALAFVLPVLVAVPGTTAALAAASAHVHLEPGDEDAVISTLTSSPDGRFVAVTVNKRDQRRQRVWVVDVADGSVAEAPGEDVRLASPAWADDGSLMTWDGMRASADLARWIDPSTGKILRTRSRSQVESSGLSTTETQSPNGHPGWWTSCTREGGAASGKYVTTIAWNGRTDRVESEGRVALSSRPGFVLIGGLRRLVHRDLTTGDVVAEITGKGEMSGSMSADGRFLHVYDRDDSLWNYTIVDAMTGAHVAGPWVLDVAHGNAGSSCYQLHGDVSEWVYVHGDQADTYLLNLVTRARVDYPQGSWPKPTACRLTDGRIAIARRNRIDVLTRDGAIEGSFLRDGSTGE